MKKKLQNETHTPSGKLFPALLTFMALFVLSQAIADPVLNQGRTIEEKIVIFPDHRNPKAFYYVPTSFQISEAHGKPQFFFYKYVYIRSDAAGSSESTAGGVLSVSLEISDERATLERIMGKGYEFKVIPIDTMISTLMYNEIGETADTRPAGTGSDSGDPEEFESKKDEDEDRSGEAEGIGRKIGQRRAPFTRKSFSIPLNRESASYLWNLFEEKKNIGLSVDCEFTSSGYELSEGKYSDAERTDRMSFPIQISMEQYPDLFKLINLANKVSFNYRTVSVLCFDFANETNPDVLKKTIEVKIETAKGQKDFRTVTFSRDSDPQQELSFNIPEKKGGGYRFRVTTVFKDGRSEKGEWQASNDSYLDVSEYELFIKEDI